METLLTDIELDIQELKCLMQTISAGGNPALRTVAKRNIRQMQERLNALTEWLEDTSDALPTPPVQQPAPIEKPLAETPAPTPTPPAQPQQTSILGERIKPATDLRHAISLNDAFRFTRELFKGDAQRMNEVVAQIGAAASLDEALQTFVTVVQPDEENEATTDFIELLKKYFS